MSNKLLKFSKQGCVPCQILSAFLSDKEVEHEEIDAFERPDKSSQYGISSVPVLILVDENGTELDRVAGFNPSNPTPVNHLLEQL